MKKLFFCLLAAFGLVLAVGCKKDDESNPADDFVGTYTVNAVANLGALGSLEIPESELTIIAKGDDGDVTVAVGSITVDGYVDDDGLHLDPAIVPWIIMEQQVQITATFPVIEAPKDGVITFTAQITANMGLMSPSGTLDVVATKK